MGQGAEQGGSFVSPLTEGDLAGDRGSSAGRLLKGCGGGTRNVNGTRKWPAALN